MNDELNKRKIGNDRSAIGSMARESQSTLGTISDLRRIRLYESVCKGDATPFDEESTGMRPMGSSRITAATLLRQ